MLVLSRRAKEVVLVGQGIEIRVIKTGRGRVLLGITAPRWISISRPDCRTQTEGATQDRDLELAANTRTLAAMRI